MNLPFTVDQFLGVFRLYNDAMWPAQWILHVLALVVIVLGLRGLPEDGRRVSGILAFLWLWAGVIYHLAFFSSVNRAAPIFAALFVAQAVLLFTIGVAQGRLAFRARSDAAGFAGGAIIAYALVIYPLLGHALGHRYPAAPTFGVPCPTTMFTLGMLLWVTPPVPKRLLVVPLVWTIVATMAALELGIREDFGLTVAAVAATALVAFPGRLGLRRAGKHNPLLMRGSR
jgi:hypothetical protein